MLYCLWDLGLKVGHATRSIDDCIRLAKADMTIRTAMLEARYLWGDQALFDELITRFDKRGGPGHRRRVRRPPSSPSATSATAAAASRAIWSSRTSRKAKGGLRDLHTLFWIAKYVYRVARSRRTGRDRACSMTPNIGCSAAAQDFLWTVRCHLHFIDRPRRGPADLRHSARHRHGSGYTDHAGSARRRTLHEALFPGRQGCRRSDRILCAALESRHAKPRPDARRVVARLRPGGRRKLRESRIS